MPTKLTRKQIETIIMNRPQGTQPRDVVAGLLKKGYELEGFQQNMGPQYGNRILPMSKEAEAEGFKDPRAIDYNQQERPSPYTDPVGWWNSHTPEQKQAILDTTGEVLGGTAGAIIGGPGIISGPVGAGAGAVLGHEAANEFGRAVGLPGNAKGTTTDQLADTAGTFALNGLGEMGGRMLPAALGAGKTVAKNAARATVTPEGRNVAALAARQGVPVRAAMVSKPAALIEQATERFPTARNIIRDARMASQEPWEANVSRIGDRYAPTPVDDQQAGQMLKGAVEGNRARAAEAYRPQYDDITKRIGNSPIDLSDFTAAAREFDTNPMIPTRVHTLVRRFAQAGATPAAPGITPEIEALAGSLSRGQSFASLSPPEQANVLKVAQRMGIAGSAAPEPTPVKFADAQQLRTQLLELHRRLAETDPAYDKSAIPKLLQGLDASIDNSLSRGSRVDQQGLSDWRDLNRQYGETHEALYGPGTAGGDGNQTAQGIATSNNPDTLPARVTNTRTQFQQAQKAAGPDIPNVPPATDAKGKPLPPPAAIPQVRRNYFDKLIDRSKVNNPQLVDRRSISPRTLEGNLERTNGMAKEILEPQGTQDLDDAITVGKAINPRDINTSGTAATTEAINQAKKVGRGIIGGPAAAIGAAATLGAPRLVAKGLTHPKLPGMLLSPAERVGFTPGGPIAGAVGRITNQAMFGPDMPETPDALEPLEPPKAVLDALPPGEHSFANGQTWRKNPDGSTDQVQ